MMAGRTQANGRLIHLGKTILQRGLCHIARNLHSW